MRYLLRSMDESRKSSAGEGKPAAIPPSMMGHSNSDSNAAEKMSKVVDEWSLMFFTGVELLYKDTEKENEWGDFGGLF